MNKTWRQIDGWFPDSSAAILSNLIKDFKIKTVTEIGSYLGKSAVFFAECGCDVSAVDTFKIGDWSEITKEIKKEIEEKAGQDFYDKFLENVYGYRIYAHRMTSEEAAGVFTPSELVYIDASHDYESVKRDIELWDSKATKVICGDDYGEKDLDKEEIYPGVRKAVDEFYGDKVAVFGRLWFVVK